MLEVPASTNGGEVITSAVMACRVWWLADEITVEGVVTGGLLTYLHKSIATVSPASRLTILNGDNDNGDERTTVNVG